MYLSVWLVYVVYISNIITWLAQSLDFDFPTFWLENASNKFKQNEKAISTQYIFGLQYN